MIGKIILGIAVTFLVAVCGIWSFLFFYPGVGKLPNQTMQESYAQQTPLFQKGRFENEQTFTLMTGEKQQEKSPQVRPQNPVPVVYSETVEPSEEGKLYVTWLGHSSFLVQMGEQNILIDPVLTTYASPVSFAGIKRFSDIAIQPENIPEIDVLLLSHDHYDHMDRETILRIDDKVKQYVVPLGVESYLIGWGIDADKIEALSWWEESSIADDLKVTITPAQHYSGRNPLRANATWWGGYYLEDANHTLYYTGDTGYASHFQEIYAKKGAVDLVLTDTGQYDPAWSMCHMTPEEAVTAAQDVHASWVIPAHWGAFVLANHAWDAPPKRMLEKIKDTEVQAATPKIGERVDYDEIASYQSRWWEEIQ